MTEPQDTPWQFDEEEGDVIDSKGNVLASIYDDPSTGRLFAAAPALRAAVEEALRIARMARPSNQAAALDRAETIFEAALKLAGGDP